MIEKEKSNQAAGDAGGDDEGPTPKLQDPQYSYVQEERVESEIRRNVPGIPESKVDIAKEKIKDGVGADEIIRDLKKPAPRPRTTRDDDEYGF